MKRFNRCLIISTICIALLINLCGCKKNENSAIVTLSPNVPSLSPSLPNNSPSVNPTNEPKPIEMDEVNLETKYGITFPVVDCRLDFDKNDPDESAMGFYAYDKNKSQVIFGAKVNEENENYLAMKVAGAKGGIIKSAFNFDVKVLSYETPSGEIIRNSSSNYTVGDIVSDNTQIENMTVTPEAAGTYVIKYTIKVKSEEQTYGFYKTIKTDETYEVTKEYIVKPYKLTVEPKKDAFEVSDKMNFDLAEIYYGTDDEVKIATIKKNLQAENYEFYLDILKLNSKKAGPQQIELCAKYKNDKISLDSMKTKNLEIDYNQFGTRYFITSIEKQNAINAREDVESAFNYQTRAALELGLEAYNKLNNAEKTYLDTVVVASTNVEKTFKIAEYNLNRLNLFEYALELFEKYLNDIFYEQDKEDFLTYLGTLGTSSENITEISDREFVLEKFATNQEHPTYIIEINKMMSDENNQTGLDYDTAASNYHDSYEEFSNGNLAYTEQSYEKLMSAYSAYLKAYGNLNSLSEVDRNAAIVIAATKYSNLITVTLPLKEYFDRVQAMNLLVENLDELLGEDFHVKELLESKLGYRFEYAPNNGVDISLPLNSAAQVIFKTTSCIVNGKTAKRFVTPTVYLNEVVTKYINLVSYLERINSEINYEQERILYLLGEKINLAIEEQAGRVINEIDPISNEGKINFVSNDDTIKTEHNYKSLLKYYEGKLSNEILDKFSDEQIENILNKKDDFTKILKDTSDDSIKEIINSIKELK